MSNSDKDNIFQTNVEQDDSEKNVLEQTDSEENDEIKIVVPQDEDDEIKVVVPEDEPVESGSPNTFGKRVAQFGIPRIIMLSFLAFLMITSGIVGMNIPSFFGDMLTRWGMWGILVLAMVPAIQSGIGPNFGVSIGIVGGLLGAVLSLEFRYTGVFAFAGDQTVAAGFAGMITAIVIGVAVATVLGLIYGMLLNRVKGSEMAISVYVGWSAIAFFNIIWQILPVTSSVLILPGRGEGIRQMLNLQDDYGGVLDNVARFQIQVFDFGRIDVRVGLLALFFLMCFLMYLFTKSRTGMRMSSAGANPAYATASGINVNKMRILGTTISTAIGAFGIIIYGQSFGFVQMYNAPLMMPFVVVASVLIGGATIRRAKVFDVLLGAFLFNGILVIALPLANQVIPDIPGLPEMLRIIMTNGIILFALTRAKGGR
jgi:simple sugar transport system permease protein